MNEIVHDYYSILSSINEDKSIFDIQSEWIQHGAVANSQGWKIHISTIPTQAEKLLRLVVPIFLQRNISFKVIKNSRLLTQLNLGLLGLYQVGKFITVYTNSDHEAVEIAEILNVLTPDFQGPTVESDLRLGKIVYARYGAFHSILERDRLGYTYTCILNPNGDLVRDSYNTPHPEFVRNPFMKHCHILKNEPSRLIMARYMIVDAIKSHPTGGVALCLDLVHPGEVQYKILKQAKAYCISDFLERDGRNRLQSQEKLHRNLQDILPIPKVEQYISTRNYGYLIMEYIQGQTLEQVVMQYQTHSWSTQPTDHKIALLNTISELCSIVENMHLAGYVHRDLTPANIMIQKTTRNVFLLDLELTHFINDPNIPFQLGTPGYISPNQEKGGAPEFEDDLYSIGCLLFFLFTKMAPDRLSRDNNFNSAIAISGISRDFLATAYSLLDNSSQNRPCLKNIQQIIKKEIELLQCGRSPKNSSNGISMNTINDVIHKGMHGMIYRADRDENSQLLGSPDINLFSNEIVSRQWKKLAVYRNANTGVAGSVYLFSRLARLGYQTDFVNQEINRTVNWLLETDPIKELPGLHFGEAGVAVAVAEALSAGLCLHTKAIETFIKRSLEGELNWPDLTHGAAGQGIAVLICFDRLRDDRLLELSHRYAEYLIENQNSDGAWTIPENMQTIGGDVYMGFAHGVSGILYFLSEYVSRFKNKVMQHHIEKAIDFLLKNSFVDGGSRRWSKSLEIKDRDLWWAHGTLGHALTFLKLYEHTSKSIYKKLAVNALSSYPESVSYYNFSISHGLAGLGEVYLEASRVLKDQQWYSRASRIANIICRLRDEENGSAIWNMDGTSYRTADLFSGSGGVLHFLARYLTSGEKLGFPLLIDP
ncbi:lanthionine synthetase LanC family protein [Paenibacillus sp. BJ-4]|uniref:lanthionine synthetase LanC family protein n=1 Tax=Paenibacillus sp. BJ-4 TaxID=2878097 RepID=UPI001CEFD502|nr:lanthionine synthetase LanC family protein [Paenibacillus sp. BJ-4]